METLIEKTRRVGSSLGMHIREEEDSRRISPQDFSTLQEAGFYKLYAPQSLGGAETDPLTMAIIIEEIARHNSNAAWSMMVANTSHWWCSNLTEEGVDEICQPDVFIAGAFHPPMRADVTDKGYTVNGRSPLTSHVHQASWVFVSAMVFENNQMKMNNGIPEMIGVFFPVGDIEIIDTWDVLGMKSTDSNDIVANAVFVPRNRTHALSPEFEPSKYFTGDLYRFPAIGTSIASLIVPIALAIAENAIAEIKKLADKKTPFASALPIRDRGVVQRKLGQAEALVQSSRVYLHSRISSCWDKTKRHESISMEERASLLLAVTHTNQSCVQAVDLMYSVAGTTGIYRKNPISGYFCDAQVIRHHGFANESRYETAGQVYLGLAPDLPVLIF